MAIVLVLACAGCAESPSYPLEPYGYEIHDTLPNLSFQSVDDAGAPRTLRLEEYFEPNAATSHLLILRVGAGWCGTCRWHLEHTQELLSLDVGSSLSLVDLVLADDDNVPAALSAVPSYRAKLDAPQTIAIDPEFQLQPAMFIRAPLPLFVIVDRRTMKIAASLNDPGPDVLYGRLRSILGDLNGTKAALMPSTDGVDGFRRDQWDLLRGMVLPGAPPSDPTNAMADDPNAAAFGKALFSDASLSPSGTVSCATCHDPQKSYADARPQSLGVVTGDRNAPSALFASHARWQFWDGRADSLWGQALGPFENPKEFASSRLFVAHALFDRYRTSYEAVFGSMPSLSDLSRFPATGKPGEASWQAMAAVDQGAVTRVYVNAGKAIAAFERSLRARPNALDAYIAGDASSLTNEQKQSLHAFFTIGCAQCHYGPRLTDDAFHVVRFPTGRQDGAADAGREEGIAKLLASEFLGTGEYSDAPERARSFAGFVSTPNMRGAFKTPPLRGVATTAPYGHGGSLATLLDVAKNYGTAGLAASDPGAVGDSEPWLSMFLGGHAPDLVPFMELLSAEPAP